MASNYGLRLREVVSNFSYTVIWLLVPIVRLHGALVSIISNRDTRFTSTFWEKLYKDTRTKLKFSIAFHPQIDGQSERTI